MSVILGPIDELRLWSSVVCFKNKLYTFFLAYFMMLNEVETQLKMLSEVGLNIPFYLNVTHGY